jgi:hypothetical protein
MMTVMMVAHATARHGADGASVITFARMGSDHHGAISLDRHRPPSGLPRIRIGEALTLNEAAQTVTTKLAYNGAIVLPAGTSKTAAKAHVASVDKTIVNAP